MCLVPCAGNVFTFVAAWEVMSLTSYFLVMTDADHEDTRRAGLWYITMTQFGLVMLLPMFFLMAPTADATGFADLRAGAAALSAGRRSAIFVLALAAFGSKAGIVPLHVWLPRAHPAAPSHVSALMSGVMIKLGIYGLLRVVLDLLGGGPAWWGGVLLALGSGSAVLGVLYALMEHDLKRLLAYHSVENVGIIFIGIGAGFTLHSYGLYGLALFGFVGGLYHTLNHACFKGLLFLGAGNVLHQTHTRNMEEMGGLITRMPQTALLMLIGSAAIAALPPLNGFASEWMVFQALLAGVRIPRPEVAVFVPVAVGMLALASGLAAACFVKAFGISFLALPRSEHAAQAHEAPWPMRVSMWLLAGACVALGLGASVIVPAFYRVFRGINGLDAAIDGAPSPGLVVHAPLETGQMSPLLIAISLAVVVLAALVGLRALRHRRPRVTDTWGCGRMVQTARMEYTASAFAEPLRRVFAALYRPTVDVTVTRHPESRFFVRSVTYQSEVQPWFEHVLYDPAVRAVREASTYVRRLQAGSVHLYLLYVAAALFVALLSVWWVR
jgi:hydrogenase-4 component B